MIIRDRLVLAKKYIEFLHELRSRISDPRVLAEDYLLRGAVERYLHLSLEAIIDVGMRLASILGLSKPERYRDVAKILRECGALNNDEARRLESWISLRNILVHGYVSVDYHRLYEILGELSELEIFINKVYRYVESRELDPEEKDLSEIMYRVREVLEKREDVLFAYIFGSYATRRSREKSDIDIAVYTKRNMSWREIIDLALELEDKLGARVDIVDLRTAPLLLIYEVVSRGIVALERDREERIEFETKILKEYLDLKPRLERYYKEVLSKQFYTETRRENSIR